MPPAPSRRWDDFEEQWLAPYAMRSSLSRGRKHPEPAHPYRTVYQRDRERIVHCTAFRRLMGKTQVLVAQINDHHRTRLTHTLEVAQISRTIARRLCLNEDLVEAIALAHDLGHPPFGHAGETALQECLADFGGFDHNIFGLRQVEEREQRYPDFPGLNLSWEVREAFVQHSGKRDHPEAACYADAGAPLLEALLVDMADSLAYDAHDIDDAIGTNLISLSDLEHVACWRRAAEPVKASYADLSQDEYRAAVVRELIAWQVGDLIASTEQRLHTYDIHSVADVRSASVRLVDFSPELCELKAELEAFLHRAVYRHHRVLKMAAKGQRFIKGLFEEYVRSPELLPERHLRRWTQAGGRGRLPIRVVPRKNETTSPIIQRIVGDYIAGMTDRFAQQEFQRLFHPFADM